jgi:hypothetical protein
MFAWGFRKQTTIATAAIAADCWRLNKLDGLLKADLAVEDDAAEMGKGHEFATQGFPSHWNVNGTIDKYLSSEFAAWVMCFGLGGVTKGGTSHLTYTCVPIVPATALELPYFTFLETIRQGASSVLDRAVLGCAINSWLLSVGTGPGRANAKLRADFLGSGKIVEPSNIVMPASATAEHTLFGSSVTATLNGVNYVTDKNLVSLEAGWNNGINADQGFYPGSDFQTSGDATTGAIRGRHEIGVRTASLKFVARFLNGSLEYTKLKAQTPGTAVVTLTYDTNNSLSLTFQQVRFKVVELGESNGIVTVAVDCQCDYHATNGVLTAVAKCDVDNICQAPA